MTTSTRFLYPIRPAARAVIFRNGQLLVQVKRREDGETYLTLPGGKQEPGESLVDCVVRECLEEVGAKVTVGPLLHVAEVFKPKDGALRHQIESLFSCEVPAGYVPRMGHHPDSSQLDTAWAAPDRDAPRFRPAYAAHLTDPSAPFYLGVFHG